MTELFIIFACYQIGSFPTAYVLVKKLKGIDIRTVGSGNVGASNAGRVLGKWKGFGLVLFIDAMKGFIPTMVLKGMFGQSDYVLLGAICLVLGHTFTMYLNFKGGKGVATGLGIFLALAPLSTAIAAVVFGILILIFKMISLSSIMAAVTIAISVWFMSEWEHLKYFTIVVAALVIILHRSNIGRILNGTENKVGRKTS